MSHSVELDDDESLAGISREVYGLACPSVFLCLPEVILRLDIVGTVRSLYDLIQIYFTPF